MVTATLGCVQQKELTFVATNGWIPIRRTLLKCVLEEECAHLMPAVKEIHLPHLLLRHLQHQSQRIATRCAEKWMVSLQILVALVTTAAVRMVLVLAISAPKAKVFVTKLKNAVMVVAVGLQF